MRGRSCRPWKGRRLAGSWSERRALRGALHMLSYPAQVAQQDQLGELGAQRRQRLGLLEAGGPALGVPGPQRRREQLLQKALLALDRGVEGAQVARADAEAGERRGHRGDLGIL